MVQDLIGELQSLEGETLHDLFKKFYLFVVANGDVISSEIEELLKKFDPANNLHKLFRLKLIDKWQRNNEFVRIFDDEDMFYICQALKCKWYFTNVEFNSSELVNDFLPNLSCSTRVKAIKQYSKHLKDTNKAEGIYNSLQKRYGVLYALTILPACSPQFVYNALLNSLTQVKPTIIAPLFRRYPDTIINFFSFILECKAAGKRMYRCFNLDKYDNVFTLIASKYPERFINSYLKYSNYFPCMKLGKRATKKLVKTNASVVIKSYKIFKNIVNLKYIVKCMNSFQIAELQAVCFPETVVHFFECRNLVELQNLTSHLKEDERQQILLRNFKNCYGKELNVENFIKVLDVKLMFSIPNDMRLKWIQIQLPTIDNDRKRGEYLSYLPPDTALPALKEMIGKQKEMITRAYLVECMLLSVRRHKKPLNLLLDCISFVLTRLRNDNQMVREKIFSELNNMQDALLCLPSEQWEPIDELIDLVKMNEGVNNVSYYFRNILSVKIQRYFVEGVPMENHLKKMLDFELSMNSNYNFVLCIGTPYEKKCLEFFLSEVQKLPCKNEIYKRNQHKTLFITLCNYNLKHANGPIAYPEWLMTAVEQFLLNKECYHWDKTSIIYAIANLPDLKHRIYMKVFPSFILPEIITYILHHQPNKISEHKEAVMKKILNSHLYEYIGLIKKITLYSKFGLPQDFINLGLWVLQTEDEEIKSNGYGPLSKPNAVTILSILMSVNEFLECIKPYKPVQGQIDRYSEKNQLQYNIQKAIASSLKYVSKPMEILNFIKTFAVGDYLKLVVGSINSVCLKVPEKKILPLLIQWLDCPVSLRKHFIRAYYKVAPLVDARKLVVSLLEKEKNISLRLLLLQQVFKFFLAEPSNESFAVFKAAYSVLNPEDVAALDDLNNLWLIPDLYIEPFIKLIWEGVELKEAPLVARNKKNVIDMIDANVLDLLSEEFCDCILRQIFLCETLTEYTRFITLYLLHVSDETIQITRLQKVLSYLKIIIENRWNDFDLKRRTVFQAREAISCVVESICRDCFQKKQFNTSHLLEELKLFLLSQISAVDILDILLLLELTIFISKNDIEDETFITDQAAFCEELLIKYSKTFGDQIIEIVASHITYSLAKSKFQLAKALLCNHKSYKAHLLAIQLIDTTIEHDLSTYKFFVEHFLQCSHPYVKAAAGGFLRNLYSNVPV